MISTSKNVQLLIATGLYLPDIGGPATYTRMLEEILPAHNFTITTVTFTSVRHLPKVIRHIVFTWRLLKVAAGKDIIYALDPVSVGVPALMVAWCTRKYFIVRLGGDYAWEQGQQRFGVTQTLDGYTNRPADIPWQVKLLARVQTFVAQRAQYVILPSEYLKRVVMQWGIHPEKIKVMYSSLYPIEVTSSKESVRAELGYTGSVVVSIGRLVPWKGFVGLLEAITLLKEDIPNLHLNIIGDGPQYAELQKKAESLGIADRITLVGKLDKKALGKAIKASDLFVLNTEYEGLSHQLLEVMDIGTPIVTTNVGGNPELIKDGITGVLVAVGDTQGLAQAIKQVLTNESTQIRLTQNARLRTKDFSQDAVAVQFATFVHSEVVGNKK